jgi:hypothetical protein
VAVGLHRQHQAGARRAAVEQDGAGAADAVLAAEMRAGEAEFIADEIGERDADRPPLGALVPLTVTVMVRLSVMLPSHAAFHGALSASRPRAFSSARRDSTAARCCR